MNIYPIDHKQTTLKPMNTKIYRNAIAVFLIVFIMFVVAYQTGTQNITGFLVAEENASNESNVTNASVFDNITNVSGIEINLTNISVSNETGNESIINVTNETGGGPTGAIAFPGNGTNKNASSGNLTNVTLANKTGNTSAGLINTTQINLEGGWLLKRDLTYPYSRDEITPEWNLYENISDQRQNVLVVDLSDMLLASEKLAQFPVNWSGGRLNLTFDVHPAFAGQCLQIGIDILFSDGSSETTDFLSFDNESFAVNDSSDYDVHMEKIDDSAWIKVNATNKVDIPAGRQLRFLIQSLCAERGEQEGKAYITNFAYSAV